jgi:adenylyltransferase/sulfurtransferase
MFNVPEISPQDLAQELESGRKLVLLDVRGDDELEISRMEGIVHIPMQDVPERLAELDPEADTVVICRVGGRSARVTAFLLQSGFKNVRNLAGGMNQWATEVDPRLPVY